MKLHPSIMSKRLVARAAQVKKLQIRICQLEIANRSLRDTNAKLKSQNRQLKCPE